MEFACNGFATTSQVLEEPACPELWPHWQPPPPVDHDWHCARLPGRLDTRFDRSDTELQTLPSPQPFHQPIITTSCLPFVHLSVDSFSLLSHFWNKKWCRKARFDCFASRLERRLSPPWTNEWSPRRMLTNRTVALVLLLNLFCTVGKFLHSPTFPYFGTLWWVWEVCRGLCCLFDSKLSLSFHCGAFVQGFAESPYDINVLS